MACSAKLDCITSLWLTIACLMPVPLQHDGIRLVVHLPVIVSVADDLLVPFDLVRCFSDGAHGETLQFFFIYNNDFGGERRLILQLSTYSSISSMICSILLLILILLSFISCGIPSEFSGGILCAWISFHTQTEQCECRRQKQLLLYYHNQPTNRNVVSTSGSRTRLSKASGSSYSKFRRAESAYRSYAPAFLRKINSEPAERTDSRHLKCPGSALVYEHVLPQKTTEIFEELCKLPRLQVVKSLDARKITSRMTIRYRVKSSCIRLSS